MVQMDKVSPATSPTSATVETLAAEVRVLMVGNRQVTLSVFRQLDTVRDGELEAFGRVNDQQRDSRFAHELTVVGRHRKTGALVRATVDPPDWSPWDGPDEWQHWLQHSDQGPDLIRASKAAVAADGKRQIVWKTYTPTGHLACPSASGEACSADVAELERKWRSEAEAELAGMLEAVAEYQRISALPLIVLAGLR